MLAAICFSAPISLGKIWPSCYVVVCSVGAVQVLNMLFGGINLFFPIRNKPKWRFVLEILAVLGSDRDYDDPPLEMNNWNPIETEAAANGIKEAIRNEN